MIRLIQILSRISREWATPRFCIASTGTCSQGKSPSFRRTRKTSQASSVSSWALKLNDKESQNRVWDNRFLGADAGNICNIAWRWWFSRIPRHLLDGGESSTVVHPLDIKHFVSHICDTVALPHACRISDQMTSCDDLLYFTL